MSSLIDILEYELKNLVSETKKKYPPIKDVSFGNKGSDVFGSHRNAQQLQNKSTVACLISH
jgi:hypothetical protein